MRFRTLYEGRHIFAIVAAIGVLGALLVWWWLVLLAALLFAFCLNFFRDPDRITPEGDELVVSAADGVVADIEEVEEGEVLKMKCRRVGVFLSVFDVHVNKTPIAGRVIYMQHYPGKPPGPYLDARHPDCSRFNEALTWAFQNLRTTVVVRQITGAIARRIVPWASLTMYQPKGGRFGMIRFGSRTEVFLPLDAEIVVKIGDKVLGGETVIAKLK